jgi:RNA polymerase sigma-70 factor (ECF subfamily)
LLIYCTLTQDDSKDFNYIYNKYHHTVYERGLAEDVMQEAFLRFYNTMGRVQTENDMRNWLFKIAKNTALDFSNKEKNYHKS